MRPTQYCCRGPRHGAASDVVWPNNLSDLDVDTIAVEIVRHFDPARYVDLLLPRKAILVDRILSDPYKKPEEYKENSIRLSAKITGKNRESYFVTLIYGTVNAFIPFDKE